MRGRGGRSGPTARAAADRVVLADREFRWLWLAAVQSLVGDQVARVALTVLVFDATGSALATGAAYSVTFLPGLAGAGLGHLADRWPRRTVMIGADLLRAGLLAVMAIPAVPVWAVCVLLAAAVAVGGPFNAASTAIVADLFTGARYRSAVAVRQAGGQAAQLAGFGAGGVLVAAVGAHGALLVDAATYAISALLVGCGVRARRVMTGPGERTDRSVWRGLAVVWADRAQRRRLAYVSLIGCWVVPEGLAAPYAAAHGTGAVGVGVLLAVLPAGYVVGSLWLTHRVSLAERRRLVAPSAVAAGLPLVACAGTPPLPVAAALWLMCGIGTGYLVVVLADYIDAAPPARRGQAAGLSSAAGLVVQGVGVLAGSGLSEAIGVGGVIALAGGIGSAFAVVLAVQARSQAVGGGGRDASS